MGQAVHVIYAFDYTTSFIESLQGREEQYWSLTESKLFLVFLYVCVCSTPSIIATNTFNEYRVAAGDKIVTFFKYVYTCMFVSFFEGTVALKYCR